MNKFLQIYRRRGSFVTSVLKKTSSRSTSNIKLICCCSLSCLCYLTFFIPLFLNSRHLISLSSTVKALGFLGGAPVRALDSCVRVCCTIDKCQDTLCIYMASSIRQRIMLYGKGLYITIAILFL